MPAEVRQDPVREEHRVVPRNTQPHVPVLVHAKRFVEQTGFLQSLKASHDGDVTGAIG
jgi:hypothetical protein